ncbi:MFS transporter [Streptomyces sp. ICN988]|uniref:MFS transporter n=1 Tax=Streptomyces sp. ICN988 TaxID=2983765 RepID=UPI0021E44F56|nr:MFS transporter [Streptomyces sp. ICN988]MCV2464430.1 MFS transporter [Streptomyces sp. ICN988]
MRPPAALRPPSALAGTLYLPRGADAAASAMTTYGVPLLVLAATGSAVWTGLAFALQWLPRIGAFTVAGTLTDRFGTARLFRAATLARAVVTLLAAGALAMADARSTVATVTVLLLAAVTGALTECSYVAAETAGGAASRAAGTQAHRVQSTLITIDQTATLAGPAAAGLLIEHGGPAAMLTTLALFSLLAAALGPRHDTAPVDRDTQQGLGAGWTTLRSLPALAWLVGGLIVSNGAVALLQAAVPVIVVTDLDHSSADAGLIWSAAAVTSLLAVTASRWAIDRWGLWPAGATAATVAAGATLAVAHADTYRSYFLLITVLMAGEGGLAVVLRTVRSHVIPADVFGSTLAVTILLLLLPYPAAGLLVAALPTAQLGHAITTAALLQTIGLAIAFTRLRRMPVMSA